MYAVLRHKKTVSKKTQDKIIRSEMPDHCIPEPISHFHPGEENIQIGFLGMKRRSTKQKKDLSKIDEISLEESRVQSNEMAGATPLPFSNDAGQTTGLYLYY